MAFTEKERKPDQSRDTGSRDKGHIASGAPVFGLPNSVMSDLISDGSDESPNGSSTIRRQLNMPHRQIPSAEAEADRLSAGVRGTNPDAVRREMGQRLNADFSGIRFHSDAASEASSGQMGARAWTSGRDVYFGKGGFEPRVAAHELVHTVQQGAARGSVSQSVPAGTVQMWWIFGSKKKEADAEDRLMTSEDKADFLFRISAGTCAYRSGKKAEKSEVFEKAFDEEMKKGLPQNNNNIIEDPDAAANRKKLSEIRAKNKESRYQTQTKDPVSNDEKERFNKHLRNIRYEDFKVIMSRWEHEAANMMDTRQNSEKETDAQKDFEAANSNSGMNLYVYELLLKTIKRDKPLDYDQWLNRYNREANHTPAEKRKIAQAKNIVKTGNDRKKNEFLKDPDNAHEMTRANKNRELYFNSIYEGKAGPKKKTRLDMLADRYRETLNANNQPAQNNQIRNDSLSLLNKEDDNNNIIEDEIDTRVKKESDDSSDNNIIETIIKKQNKSFDNSLGNSLDMSNSDLNKSFYEKPENDDLLSGLKEMPEKKDLLSGPKGMSEKEDLLSGLKGMRESDDNDSDSGDQNSILGIYNHPMKKDPNKVRHFNGFEIIDPAEDFASANANVGKGKKYSGKIGLWGNVGKSAHSLSQLGMVANNIDPSKAKNWYTEFAGPAVSGTAGILGTVGGAVGTITGAYDSYRNYKNQGAGGSKWETANSVMDTLASVGSVGSGILTSAKGLSSFSSSVLDFIGGGIGDKLGKVASFGGESMVPGLNIATGGLTALAGANQWARGQHSINKIDTQLKAFNRLHRGKELSKDQQKLKNIFNQGRRVSEFRRTSGALKTISGGITAATGALSLATGPLAPLTAGIMALAGAASGIGRYFYDRIKKKNLRKDVTAEAMGIKWKDEVKKVKQMFPEENLSDKEARTIILKGHGFDDGSRKKAFKAINMDRAQYLMDTYEKGGAEGKMAQQVIAALGVFRKNNHSRYAKGAQKLLADKLGAG